MPSDHEPGSIHSVAIIGAGALGIMYGAALVTVPDIEAYFLVDDARAARMRAATNDATARFTVNGAAVSIPVRTPSQLARRPGERSSATPVDTARRGGEAGNAERPAAAGRTANAGEAGEAGAAGRPTTVAADLVIVAVKNHHLADIVSLLQAAAGPGTTVVSVLNGIDSEGFIEEQCPEATVLRCVALGMDAVREGGALTYTKSGRLLLGTKDNEREHPALRALTALLDKAGLAWETPADIHRELWWKLMINIGVNQVSAVTGAPYGVFQSDGRAKAIMEGAMRETIAVARAEGIDLRDEDLTNWYPILNTLSPDGKTSMLQDMEQGRITEAPSFGGRIMELAAKHGIPVPVNETLVRIIAIRESLSQGS